MENQKFLHPSVDVLRVDGSDKESLEIAMVLLHDIGWVAQQCGIDQSLDRLKEYYNADPERFISGCAHGAAALHGVLGRTTEVP